MPLRRLVLSTALLTASLVVPAFAQQSALTSDPAPDKANPAAMHSFQLPSHGVLLNALVYIASGPGPHPVVLLLHGFPGNERNLDLAQTLRRAGYDVLYFNYRGAWGSPGDFSFTHAIEDTEAAIAYLHDPANTRKLRADPQSLTLIGHSMGGMIAAIVGAAHSTDTSIHAIGLISAANMAGRVLPAVTAHRETVALPAIAHGLAAEGIAPLAGCTPESLAQELLDHAAAWNIPGLAPRLATHPLFAISSDDGNAPSSEALLANLKKLGDTATSATHIATDHSYSDHRIALQAAVLEALAQIHQH
ncbi:alpha/beta fold hydrolase [Granulicella sp. dw_53]|uniref:alpha/beta hydrolase family protein n=1 Tax=Granulicella sp. dw_53 TaxID=2719792 RepID=UPI001BD2FF6B|nr:alpha/beta fold hydrolase [Granulicella sp. dw_53]